MSAISNTDEERTIAHMIYMHTGGAALEAGKKQAGVFQGDLQHQVALVKGESTQRVTSVLDARNIFQTIAMMPKSSSAEHLPLSIGSPMQITLGQRQTTVQTYEGLDPAFAKQIAASEKTLHRFLSTKDIEYFSSRRRPPPPQQESVAEFMGKWSQEYASLFFRKQSQILNTELGRLGTYAMREASFIDDRRIRDRLLSLAGKHIHDARANIIKCQKDIKCLGFNGINYHSFADHEAEVARAGVQEAVRWAKN